MVHKRGAVLVGTAGGQLVELRLPAEGAPAGGAPSALEEAWRYTVHGCPVRALAIIEEGTMVVTGAQDAMIKVWGLRPAGGVAPLVALSGHMGPVVCLSESAVREESAEEEDDDEGEDEARPGPLLVSGALDGTLRVWDIRKGKALYGMLGHTAYLSKVQVDGPHLLADGTNNVMLVHDFSVVL